MSSTEVVRFQYGLQAAYTAADKDLNSFYFCTDTQRFFVGETEYSRPVQHGDSIPESYLPPNSFFVKEAGTERELYYSKDGKSWELVSFLPSEVSGGVFGINTNLSPKAGEEIVIPRLTVNEHGYVTSASNQNVKLPTLPVRLHAKVTDSDPEVDEGFVFDTESFALYLDLEGTRYQVKDPLKLSLAGGKVTGKIEVVNHEGTTVSSFDTEGSIVGKSLQLTGELSVETTPDSFAVFGADGRIHSRTKEELRKDLGVSDLPSLGQLAYKSEATGEYIPIGTIETPTITAKTSSQSVVTTVNGGGISTTVDAELLTISNAAITSESADVIKSIDSITSSDITFTGTPGEVTVK